MLIAKNRFQEQLRLHLGSSENEADPYIAWEDIRTAVETTATSISDLNQRVAKNHWISTKSIALMDSRKLIPSGSEHNEERKQVRCGLTKSLRNSCEVVGNKSKRDGKDSGCRQHKTNFQTSKRNWN
ncbi:unnamed protein product [Schistosoma curassoni]|uniref:Peptidase_M13_N domain-containing protein n=1 Tax=Schistosoma curassoni TaxID=6186 RepID=A0A183L1M4_9TREM|nr:unnamed protein product [Schistosoma curassoni]